MLDINSPVQWQLRDEKYPTLMPWFTHGMLNELKKWDLSNKEVVEWGGGWSTIFWGYHAKSVITIETNKKWIEDIIEYLNSLGWITEEYTTILGFSSLIHLAYSAIKEDKHITIFHREVNEGDNSKIDFYTWLSEYSKPDIVCIDGVLRHECLLKAIALPRPLIIIHDNWQQDGFVCPASEELMAPYEIHNFTQEDHTDNHGRKWATAYWELK